MKAINFRERVMLSCMLVLIFFFASIFIRLAAVQIFVKRLHWDNALTQAILFDNEVLRKIDSRSLQKPVSIDWEAAYPFGEKKSVTLWQRAKSLEFKIRDIEDKKIGDWTSKHLVEYAWLVEAGRGVEREAGWNVINPAMKVYKLSDGYLTFADRKQEQEERIDSLADFADFVKAQGCEFLYIQSPGKSNPFADKELNGIDYSNANTDELLQGLRERNIAVYDLRSDLHEAVGDAGWHQAFFRTDHHWKPSTALWAAKKVAEKLADGYGVDVNFAHFAPEDYDVVRYERYFLGSQGKKVTLANTEPDDFDVYYPKFSTHLYAKIPSRSVDGEGDFTILYDEQALGTGDFYNESPYAMYGYGDQAEIIVHNYENENLRDKRILLIHDSMLDTAMPFLVMGVKDLRELDIRHFKGSVQKYVEDYQPDIVLVMYKTSYSEPINWLGHGDKFDFR